MCSVESTSATRRRRRLVHPVHQGRDPRRRHRRLVASGRAPHPPTHPPRRRAGSGALVGRVRGRLRPRPDRRDVGGDLRSPASSTAWSCSTTAVESIRPAKLWNDTESAPDAGWLLEQLPAAPPAWAAGVRLRAGRRVHDHQAVVAAPQRARGVGAAGPRAAAARLADLPAAGRVRHRPRRRVGHRLLVAGGGALPLDLLAIVDGDRDWSTLRARGARPAEPAGRVARRGRRARAPATTWRPRSGLGLRAGRRRRLARHVGHRVRGRASAPTADPSGAVAGFADATGRFLPLVCTLNATKVTDAVAPAARRRPRRARRARARRAAPARGGLTLLPYFDGERTPNRPDATGMLTGLRTDVDARDARPGRVRRRGVRSARRPRRAAARHAPPRRRPAAGSSAAERARRRTARCSPICGPASCTTTATARRGDRGVRAGGRRARPPVARRRAGRLGRGRAPVRVPWTPSRPPGSPTPRRWRCEPATRALRDASGTPAADAEQQLGDELVEPLVAVALRARARRRRTAASRSAASASAPSRRAASARRARRPCAVGERLLDLGVVAEALRPSRARIR